MQKENYERMRVSIQKLLDMFYEEERDHFGAEDEETFDEFIVRIKEHVLYDLIVVFHEGDEKNIMDDIKGIYEEYYPEDEDEESN